MTTTLPDGTPYGGGLLKCVFCLFVGVPPLDRGPEDGDEPRDGLAVTVVGGTAVCGLHVNAVMPDDVAWLIKQFGEQMRRRDAEEVTR